MINEKLTVKWYYINVNERNKVLHTEMLFSDIFLSRLWPGGTLTDITMCKRHQGSTRQRESVSQRAGRQPRGGVGGGGLAARSGTEFTTLHDRPSDPPQLRNLAEWDWVPFSLEGRWAFARFWVLPRPNSKKRFSRTLLMEFLDIRRRDVWTVHLHLSWFGISASSVIYKLGEFLSNQPSSISYIFPPGVVLRTLFLILNICYVLTILVWVLQ